MKSHAEDVNISIWDLMEVTWCVCASRDEMETRKQSDTLVNWNGRQKLIHLYGEDNIFKFCLSREANLAEDPDTMNESHTSGKAMAEQCARKSDENNDRLSHEAATLPSTNQQQTKIAR